MHIWFVARESGRRKSKLSQHVEVGGSWERGKKGSISNMELFMAQNSLTLTPAYTHTHTHTQLTCESVIRIHLIVTLCATAVLIELLVVLTTVLTELLAVLTTVLTELLAVLTAVLALSLWVGRGLEAL